MRIWGTLRANGVFFLEEHKQSRLILHVVDILRSIQFLNDAWIFRYCVLSCIMAMCPCSPGSQPYPGLHQKQCGQQVKRGDPAPLFCAGKASPGVLHPDVESSVQERHGSVGAHPKKGRKSDPHNGTPLLWKQAERAGAVQPGQEKASGRSENGLSVSKGEL